jgi:hypothetical protein
MKFFINEYDDIFHAFLELLDLARADLHMNLKIAVVDELLLALLTLEPFPHLYKTFTKRMFYHNKYGNCTVFERIVSQD